jgi:hypothetical protein
VTVRDFAAKERNFSFAQNALSNPSTQQSTIFPQPTHHNTPKTSQNTSHGNQIPLDKTRPLKKGTNKAQYAWRITPSREKAKLKHTVKATAVIPKHPFDVGHPALSASILQYPILDA